MLPWTWWLKKRHYDLMSEKVYDLWFFLAVPTKNSFPTGMIHAELEPLLISPVKAPILELPSLATFQHEYYHAYAKIPVNEGIIGVFKHFSKAVFKSVSLKLDGKQLFIGTPEKPASVTIKPETPMGFEGEMSKPVTISHENWAYLSKFVENAVELELCLPESNPIYPALVVCHFWEGSQMTVCCGIACVDS